MKFIYVPPGITLKIPNYNIVDYISTDLTEECFIVIVRDSGVLYLDEEGTLNISYDRFDEFMPAFHTMIQGIANGMEFQEAFSSFFDKLQEMGIHE